MVHRHLSSQSLLSHLTCELLSTIWLDCAGAPSQPNTRSAHVASSHGVSSVIFVSCTVHTIRIGVRIRFSRSHIMHILSGVRIQLARDVSASLHERASEDHSGQLSATACGRSLLPWVGTTQSWRKLHGDGHESRLDAANRCESTVMMGSLPWRHLHQANTLSMSV